MDHGVYMYVYSEATSGQKAKERIFICMAESIAFLATNRQTDRQTDRQTNKQIDRADQTEKDQKVSSIVSFIYLSIYLSKTRLHIRQAGLLSGLCVFMQLLRILTWKGNLRSATTYMYNSTVPLLW